ncbi:MAG: lysophospholipase [Defluviitaleaceae bacterium]|nr:lysophospholipase [Defluviitaleaceae bacterium]
MGVLRIVYGLALIPPLVYLFLRIRDGYRLAYSGSHPKRASPAFLKDIPFEKQYFTFISKGKIELAAVALFSCKPSRGTILAFHYLGGSKTSIISYIEPLLNHGYDIIAFDYLNHGDSPDTRSVRYRLGKDLRCFIETVRSRGFKGPFGTIGFSMGATPAIEALEYAPDIKACAVDSGPLIFVRDYFKYVLRNKQVSNKITQAAFLFINLYLGGFIRMSHQTKKRLHRLKGVPVMFIHSRTDKAITYDNALYAYGTVCSERTRFITVDRAHHLTNHVVLGRDYGNALCEFFDKWMMEDV